MEKVGSVGHRDERERGVKKWRMTEGEGKKGRLKRKRGEWEWRGRLEKEKARDDSKGGWGKKGWQGGGVA